MKKIKRFVCISFLGLMILASFQTIQASQPSLLSLKMDMKLEVLPLEGDKQFRVIFNFTPLEDIKSDNNLEDEAQIVYDSKGFQLISGNPTWGGKLIKGQSNKIEVTLQALKDGIYSFFGVVNSKQIDLTKLPYKRTKSKKSFLYKNVVLQELKLGKVDGRQEIWVIDAQTGKATKQMVAPPKFPVGTVDTVKVQKSPKKKRGANPMPDSGQSGSSPQGRENMGPPFSVSGTFRFLDNYGAYQPIQNCQVIVLFYNPGNGKWEIDTDDNTTSQFGYFSILTPYPRIQVWVLSRNDGCIAVYSEDHRISVGDNLYLYGWGFGIDGLNQDVVVDLQYTTVNNLDTSGGFNIANEMLRGFDRVIDIVGYIYRPDTSFVYWDALDTVTSLYGRFAVGGTGLIMIASRNSTKQNDEWDGSVMLHEYSHFIMDEYAELPPQSGGDEHWYWYPVYGGVSITPRQAWVEGWANFLQGVLRFSSDYVDLDSNNEELLSIDMEIPAPDVPYIHDYQFNGIDQLAPSSIQPIYNAYDVEGSITEALWDIYDVANDGNYFQFGQLYGHNNDYNQSDPWRGINAIWDVFWDYDPAPTDDNHDHCWDFFEFIRGWGASGYPIVGNFSKICNSHALYIKRGDANFDTKILLTDEIFLINYLFQSGPAPLTVCNGDANNDGSITLPDIVFLINYIFKSGPAPTPALC